MNIDIDKPCAFLARRFTAAVEAKINELYMVQINEDDSILTTEQLIKQAKGSEILFVSVTESLPRSLFEALSGTLKYVATLSVGFDHIDLDAARDHGVRVLHSPDVLSEACAEIAMMLLLNAARRGYEADQMVRTLNWPGWAPTQLLGKGLVGKKMGILGLGRIGRELAKRAKSFGMEIHYHNPMPLPSSETDGAVYHDTVDSLLSISEFFSINAPGVPALIGFLNKERIAQLPAGAVVINISRGDMVDDDALIDALKSGHLFSAGLDVFQNEPDIDPRYAELQNVFLSPHLGSGTTETRDAMGLILLDGLTELERGNEPANCIA